MHDNYKQLIEKLLPDATEREAFFSCYREFLPKSIKIIEHAISVEAFTEYTKWEGRTLTPPPFTRDNDSRYISRSNDSLALGKHWLHTAGFFYIQEVAASLAVGSLNVQAWDTILDMCAAPGGKSTQIADKLLTSHIPHTNDISHPWLVVSNEVSWSRIIALQSNLNRTGCYNTAITQLDGIEFWNLLPDFFDKVLLDAPCSGEWTWFKSDAATRWRREEDVQKIARLQYLLLVSAINTCKPWGTIVYATCTLNPRENEWVITKVLQEYGGAIELEPVEITSKSAGLTQWDNEGLLSRSDAEKVARFWPHRQHTGWFFIAKIRKLSSHESSTTDTNTTGKNQHRKKLKKDSQRTNNFDISDNLQKKIAKMLLEDYGISVDPAKHFFASTSKQVYLVSPHYMSIHELLYVEKIGVPVLKRHNDTELHPLHGLGTMLGSLANKNTIQLTAKECQRYSDGYDLDTDATITTKNKYAILKRERYGFSVGKVVWNTIKNKFLN